MPIEGELPPDSGARAPRGDRVRRTRATLDRYAVPSESHRKTVAERSSFPVYGANREPLNKAARRQLEG